MVKELREKTGAGMMDCKTALTETKGDIERPIDWLRKKGLSKAAKKAGRVAAEGLVGIVPGRPAPLSRSTPRRISSPATSSSRNGDAKIASLPPATSTATSRTAGHTYPGKTVTVDEPSKRRSPRSART